MEINKAMSQNISGIRHAISSTVLKKTLNRDALAMAVLLRGFHETNKKIMENSVAPYRGSNIDIKA